MFGVFVEGGWRIFEGIVEMFLEGIQRCFRKFLGVI